MQMHTLRYAPTANHMAMAAFPIAQHVDIDRSIDMISAFALTSTHRRLSSKLLSRYYCIYFITISNGMREKKKKISNKLANTSIYSIARKHGIKTAFICLLLT